jgi:fumarate reductase flavoprotein subunit
MDHISLVNSPKAIDGFAYQVDFAEESNYHAFVVADSIEELAEKTGINSDKLIEAIEIYNDYCDRGRDERFGKHERFLRPIRKGKFYAGKFYVSAYGTLGGLKINSRCEVHNTENKPIPGLFAAGTDANTIYGDSYNFYLPGNSMGFAVNTGRMAADAAIEYINP